ncbi:MAG: hypothetical protein U5R49_05410 [Deltaproteobacteria bacterium]|nr:hypothetical protein [Deltaproteobacteria bacterium]
MPSNPAHKSKIASIAISRKKGIPKETVTQASLLKDHGIEGDAHAGPWHRQVSFLAAESIDGAREKGLDVDFGRVIKGGMIRRGDPVRIIRDS